jgi:hypothetical protein
MSDSTFESRGHPVGMNPARNDAGYAELHDDSHLLGKSERELRALTFVLVKRLAEIRGQRGRDFILSLPFGDVLDRLDAAAASARFRAARSDKRGEP